MDGGTWSLQNIIMAVSAALIFGSLLAVFIQIHKASKVARSQVYQNITDSAGNFARFTMSYPDLLEFFKTFSYNPNTMKNITTEQAFWAALMALDFWENLFYQHEQGMLPEPLWEHRRIDIKRATKASGFHEYWDVVKSHYYKEFREFIDQLMTQNHSLS